MVSSKIAGTAVTAIFFTFQNMANPIRSDFTFCVILTSLEEGIDLDKGHDIDKYLEAVDKWGFRCEIR